MSKFWTAVAALLVAGLGFLAFAAGDSQVTFSDLETECRYDRSENADFTLVDRRIHFEGMFPVQNTDARLDYGYKRSGGKVVLDVRSEKMRPPRSFVDSCLGVAVYDARTGELSPGTYDVRIKHNGDLQKRQVIEVN